MAPCTLIMHASEDPDGGEGCRGCCKYEMSRSSWLLGYHRPQLFYTSQWAWPLPVYLAYRWIIAIFFIVWIILSGAWTYDWSNSEANRVKWFIYLTNWGFFLLTVDVIYQAIVVSVCLSKYNNREKDNLIQPHAQMTWYLKLQWVLYNISSASCLIITASFWSLFWSGGAVHPVDVVTHAANTVYTLLNLFVTAVPVRPLHVFHTVIFCLIYVIFSVVYEYAGGTNGVDNAGIYTILSWRNAPGWSSVYAIGLGLIGSVVVWLIIYGLYRARVDMYNCCHHKQVDHEGAELSSTRTGTENLAYTQ